MEDIQMVDLVGQYQAIKDEIDSAIINCIESGSFIKGPIYEKFQNELAAFLGVKHVIGCANGTDALQIAFMALNLSPGDEVILPAFTYVATAEVIALLGLTPVLVDVNPETFNIDPECVRKAITNKSRAIVPVHLFGQCAEMEQLLNIAKEFNLYVIEDNAQALGSTYTFQDGREKRAGSLGHIGCTSFFPSKNLGCFGDGGAVFTDDDELANKMRMIANHGQPKKYTHDIIGINSRLDALQAGILSVKLKYLDEYNSKRKEVAKRYDRAFGVLEELVSPICIANSDHVFNQYTVLVRENRREELRDYLKVNGVPSMIYYPLPLHQQKAFQKISRISAKLNIAETLCESVLSLPIHTEMSSDQQNYIIRKVNDFFL